jgi:hypothetical protein
MRQSFLKSLRRATQVKSVLVWPAISHGLRDFVRHDGRCVIAKTRERGLENESKTGEQLTPTAGDGPTILDSSTTVSGSSLTGRRRRQ